MDDIITTRPTSGDAPQLKIPGTPDFVAPAALTNPKADIAALDSLERHLYAHRYAEAGIQSFNGTIDPVAASADSGEALAILEQEDHELICAPETGELLARLEAHDELLNETQRAQVRVLMRERATKVNVPSQLMADFTRATTESFAVWQRAKAANDWASFAPQLDHIVELLREIAAYRNPSADPYDVLLDEFEHGRGRVFYDAFFDQVREIVVPLFAAVAKSGRQPSTNAFKGHFDANRQWALADDLVDLEGLRREALFVTATEHPFSDALTTNYAIIAGHVHEDDVISNVYSMLHEGGHALYEQGVNPAFNYTSLKGGTSMGMHEAQSRFFENYVGRSEEFAPHLLALLRKHFPGQLGRVTARQLYQATNRAEGSLIRTEADELTYPLHVLVRYEIEQLLLSGEAAAADVPRLWAQKYRSYLGVTVPDDTRGALQDVHWSQGMLGYFPTYALGNAYGAQLRAAMIRSGMGYHDLLAQGNLGPIRDWLGANVWWHGRSKDPEQIIEDACGEPFSATYYTDYLVEKFSAIYGL